MKLMNGVMIMKKMKKVMMMPRVKEMMKKKMVKMKMVELISLEWQICLDDDDGLCRVDEERQKHQRASREVARHNWELDSEPEDRRREQRCASPCSRDTHDVDRHSTAALASCHHLQ